VTQAGREGRGCHLLRKGAVPQSYILLGVGEYGLQGTSQVLFTEVLGRPHEGRQGHGHLHLHAGKVLQEQGKQSGPQHPGPRACSTY
jgi:hypothetical protein